MVTGKLSRISIVESEHFIEWLVPDMVLPEIKRLVALQRELAKWRCGLGELWQDERKREHMADSAQRHSKEVLEMSGLLSESPQS